MARRNRTPASFPLQQVKSVQAIAAEKKDISVQAEFDADESVDVPEAQIEYIELTDGKGKQDALDGDW